MTYKRIHTGIMQESLLEGLNEHQKDAVTTIDKPLIVFAGPGTGKTRITTTKLAYLLKEKGMRPEEVVALTYGEKAAAEMGDRVEKLVPGISGVRISTFHSFCFELVRENTLELGLGTIAGVISDNHQNAFIYQHLDDFKLEHFSIPKTPIDLASTMQDTISRCKQENISVAKLERYLEKHKSDATDDIGKLGDLAKVYKAYEAFKAEKCLLDYGDMQMLALKLLEERPEILARYQGSVTL
jgi:DNA helicase-2/ATP-dependent DNA helicase PcrA